MNAVTSTLQKALLASSQISLCEVSAVPAPGSLVVAETPDFRAILRCKRENWAAPPRDDNVRGRRRSGMSTEALQK